MAEHDPPSQESLDEMIRLQKEILKQNRALVGQAKRDKASCLLRIFAVLLIIAVPVGMFIWFMYLSE